MVDDVAQVDLAARSAVAHGVTVRLCLDVDASLRVKIGPLAAHLGVRRSPVHTAADAGALAAAIAARPGVDVVGVMFYEAQVAGLPDSSAAVRAVKRLSIADLASRRAAVVAAVEDAVGHPLSLVNSGGSGSIASSAADPAVTEVTAGSGLFVPTLFDGYRSFTPRPAAFFGLDVVRIPAAGFATVFGGGYIASGPATKSRQPRRSGPRGLSLTSREGAGEVQTPAAPDRRRRPARRRPGLVPARQVGRGHGALRVGAPGPRHRRSRPPSPPTAANPTPSADECRGPGRARGACAPRR